MRVVVCSDTHKMHDQIDVPEGDLFIHAGDFLGFGTLDEVEDFNAFLLSLPHPHKVVIAGNHDWAFEKSPHEAQKLLTGAIYLQDESVYINGLKIYGSPWQPEFFNWAFNLKRGDELKQKWDLIPSDTDILITHGPPFGIGDAVGGNHVGCEELLKALDRIKPKYHIFGHIHEGYGIVKGTDTVFINASNCNALYDPVNPPIIFEMTG